VQFLKATSPLISVPALLASTPGGQLKNSSELRSFFSGTMPFSNAELRDGTRGRDWPRSA